AVSIPAYADPDAVKKTKASKAAKTKKSNVNKQPICENGLETMNTLINARGDITNRCFTDFLGRAIQFVDVQQALFSFGTESNMPEALIDFRKTYDIVNRQPDVFLFRLVRAKGVYKYTTVLGEKRTVSYFETVPVSLTSEVIEREAKKHSELKMLSKRDEADKKWMDKVMATTDQAIKAAPYTFADQMTGFMWTRNMNVAGITMDCSVAVKWVKNLNYAGYNDWRLPTRTEAETMANNITYDNFYNSQNIHISTSDYKRYICLADDLQTDRNGYEVYDFRVPRYNYLVWPVRNAKENIPVQQTLH
ncbi:MAG: DUF1566 domain-containing protein, partial [Desulfuromonadales bacterium]